LRFRPETYGAHPVRAHRSERLESRRTMRKASATTFEDKIGRAFGHRPLPQTTVSFRGVITLEQQDALWFAGGDWRTLSEEDWEDHPDAVLTFTKEAFRYYLPSIVLLTANGKRLLLAADAIIRTLDRSPTISYWNEFLTSRLLGLSDEEYEVIKEWILSLSGKVYVDAEKAYVNAENALERAYETVHLLQQETARLRNGC
jgi:hypothetical protein